MTLVWFAIAAAVIGALIALGVPALLLCVVGAVMGCFAILAAACQSESSPYPDEGDQL